MAKTDPLRFTIAFATMIEFVPRTGQGKGQNKERFDESSDLLWKKPDQRSLFRVFWTAVDPQDATICPTKRDQVRYRFDKYGNGGCSILSPNSSRICPENDRERTTDRSGVLVRF